MTRMKQMLDIEHAPELLGYLLAEGWIDPKRAPRDRRAPGRRFEQDRAGRAHQRRCLGAQTGAGQAAGAGRLVLPGGAGAPRSARSALAGSRSPHRKPPPLSSSRTSSTISSPWRRCRNRTRTGSRCCCAVRWFPITSTSSPPCSARFIAKARIRRAELEPVFGDRGFFESLRLEPYFGFTASEVPEARQFLLDLIDETRAHVETLVHGDYSPKNILVHDGRLVLLDHEVIHFGDPTFDLGFSLTHFLSKAHHLPDRREAFAEATRRYWDRYRSIVADRAMGERSGRPRGTQDARCAARPGAGPLAIGISRPNRARPAGRRSDRPDGRSARDRARADRCLSESNCRNGVQVDVRHPLAVRSGNPR